MLRRFTNTLEGHNKFWCIDIFSPSLRVRMNGKQAGADLIVWWGRIGTKGQQKVKAFLTPQGASTEASRLVREKLGKGYVEQVKPSPPPAPLPKFQAKPRPLARAKSLIVAEKQTTIKPTAQLKHRHITFDEEA